MKKEIVGEKVPIKLWLDNIEGGALKQVKNLANLPFAFHHVALMPDAHEGYGMPIGGVLATKNVIVPNAVGVDIGCGMCAQKTSLRSIDVSILKRIMSAIRQAVPLGFRKHEKFQDEKLMPRLKITDGVIQKEWKNALKSLGSLGGGNHFIEIQKGSDGYVWIMLHSGSRNLGKQVAEYYDQKAKQECLTRGFDNLVKQGLSFLDFDSRIGQRYFAEMNTCVEYALANRKLIMERIKQAFVENVDEKFVWQDFINIAHNYAALERHFGENVLVHRKGATQAQKDQIGIIPGSQGTKSYIVRGLGNLESFQSCSHGAGRRMGRNQAVRELDLKTEIEKLDRQGIVHAIRTKKDLDEASGAYKDISEVMRNQVDLVEILVELSPLAVVKG